MVTRLALQGASVASLAAGAGFIAGFLTDRINPSTALVVLVLVSFIAIAAGMLAFKGTGEAIEEVEAAAAKLASGELGVRVMADGAASSISRSFNAMAGQLQTVFDAQSAEQARLGAVFDAVTDAMVALARDTSVRFMNPAAESQLQVTASEAIGRPFIQSVLDFELDGLARETIASGQVQSRLITFGQRRTPFRASVVPIRGGGEWAVLLMLIDLTEERRLDTVRREFVANVSHELRTPLASIRALTESIENGYVDANDLPEFTGRIQAQVSRLTTLVNELLDLSRIESGAITLLPERVVLADIVHETLGVLQPRMQSGGVTSDVAGDNTVAVEADRTSLVRVLSNLLDNAIKYSPPGGTIRVEIREDQDIGEITIHDDGPGVALEDRTRIFERFYTGDRSRASTGVGLGLAIVKHLVRAHNGSVEVEGGPGRGATFTLRLPRRFSGFRAADRFR